MNAHSIRHAWFSPSIPKRKERELDAESEWPSAYHPLAGPAPSPRPAKRLRGLEGGFAGLTLDTNQVLAPEPPSQIHDAPLGGDAEPYISSIYEWPSPHTGVSSVASLPLKGVVSEVNTSDEDEAPMEDDRMGEDVLVQGDTIPYTVTEPDEGKKGKRTWYEPEKDRIVVLDLDSSEDESVTRSPRRRRSAFSLSSGSSSSTSRPRSQTDAPPPQFIINSTLLSHIAPPSVASFPREEDPAKAVVLFRPVAWGAGAREEKDDDTPATKEVKAMEAPLTIVDDDAMDIDS